ncbi:hypothetical protein DIPPA_70090 [Diplonema papillatum]|nr:hypothetical protein DIPPA_70090 [Diplonema papillatum]
MQRGLGAIVLLIVSLLVLSVLQAADVSFSVQRLNLIVHIENGEHAGSLRPRFLREKTSVAVPAENDPANTSSCLYLKRGLFYSPFSHTSAETSFHRKQTLTHDLADLQKVLHLVARGGRQTTEWGLFCGKDSASREKSFGSNNKPNRPRCYVHKRRCAAPGSFKIFVYPSLQEYKGVRAGQFFEAVHKSMQPGSRNHNYVTDNPSEACLFLLGVDTLMFGNARGLLPGNWDEGNSLLANYSPHGSPPFSSWLDTGSNIGQFTSSSRGSRSTWGLNHLGLGFSDWHIDDEHSYSNQGMLAVRSSTTADTFQPGVDVNIALPKVVGTAAVNYTAADKREHMMFFSGSVYDFHSPRYQLRFLRDLSPTLRIWLYCYDKTKKVRSSRKWEKMKARCAPETSRSVRDGFMPGFKKRGGEMMPPAVFTGISADVYTEEMRKATFCAIIRGWGFHSYRLTEALYFGCIPVIFEPGPESPRRRDETYLADSPVRSVLPFVELIDWSKIAVFASEDDLYTAEGRTKLVSELQRMKHQSALILQMQVLGKQAHDEILGADNLNDSMAVMMSSVAKTFEYRATLLDHLLDTVKVSAFSTAS